MYLLPILLPRNHRNRPRHHTSTFHSHSRIGRDRHRTGSVSTCERPGFLSWVGDMGTRLQIREERVPIWTLLTCLIDRDEHQEMTMVGTNLGRPIRWVFPERRRVVSLCQ